MHEPGDERLPIGADWQLRRRKDERGRAIFGYRPPNLVERFWAWPVGAALLVGIGSVVPDATPLVYFAGGAVLVAFYNELRLQTVRQNHNALWDEIRRLRVHVASEAKPTGAL